VHYCPQFARAPEAWIEDDRPTWPNDKGGAMKSFIRAVELWVPDETRSSLEYGGGQYAEGLDEFREISELAVFPYDEGLPGKAWAAQHPIIVSRLSDSNFRRADEARLFGLTCGVALPVLAGDDVKAVLGLLCGSDAEENVGAIELWHNNSELSHEMALVDGYYGTAAMFEFNSRHTTFPRGYGLPGKAWKADGPVIIKNLGRAQQFLRAADAALSGIDFGLAVPYRTSPSETWVVSFLSAPGTPIARRFEIWKADLEQDALVFDCGHCIGGTNLDVAFADGVISRNEGAIGQAWASGLPVLCSDLKSDPSIAAQAAKKAGLNQAVVLPTFNGDQLRSMIAWYP
jgi:hypothetical protein